MKFKLYEEMPMNTPIYELNSYDVWSRQSESVLCVALYAVGREGAYRLYIPEPMLYEWLEIGIIQKVSIEDPQPIYQKLKRAFYGMSE